MKTVIFAGGLGTRFSENILLYPNACKKQTNGYNLSPAQ